MRGAKSQFTLATSSAPLRHPYQPPLNQFHPPANKNIYNCPFPEIHFHDTLKMALYHYQTPPLWRAGPCPSTLIGVQLSLYRPLSDAPQ